MKRRLLVVPGLPRCATTSFINVLSQHPSVYSSQMKEPHFFIPDYKKKKLFAFEKNGGETKFNKLGFITNYKDYEKIFSSFRENQIYLDASTLYSIHVESIQEIKQYEFLNPTFILFYRDPFKRALSHYLFSVSRGEEFRSFRDAMEDEVNGKYPSWLIGGYIRGSLHTPCLNEITRCFGEKKFMLVNIDKVEIFSKKFMNKVTAFLEIEPFNFNFDVYTNPSNFLDSKLQRKLRIIARKVRQVNPSFFDNKLTRLFFNFAMTTLRKKKTEIENFNEIAGLYNKYLGVVTKKNL